MLMQKLYNQINYNTRRMVAALGCTLALAGLTLPASAQLAPPDCKFLGNIIASSVPSNFGSYWNQVTPENAGKWGSAEPTRDNMSWGQLDLAYEYAQQNNLPFKHHTFVWGQQQPNWIDALTPQEQKEEVEEWIKLYSERYPATEFVDVVNEPLHAPPSYRSSLGGGGATGWDWVIWSFEKARQYMPNAKLLINDYNILNTPTKTDNYIKIIKLLQDRDLIDGIGLQAHFLETTPLSVIKSNLDKLAATGLPIYVSEYDVNIANDQNQLNKYKEQFPVLWQHPGVRGMTLWGYQQGQIWRTDAYLLTSNGTERPALTWLRQYLQTEGNKYCDPNAVVTPTGIKESLLQQQIKVYPNPASNGTFTLQFEHELYEEVKVYRVDGQLVETVPIASQQKVKINLSVSPGTYMLQFRNSKTTVTKRLMVE